MEHKGGRTMKFLSVRDLRSKSAEVWKGLTAEREMVVTSNGRPIAILSAVTEETLEETLAAIRRSRAVAAVSEIQRQSVRRGKDAISPAEIDAEITSVRQARRRQDHTRR
jgi:antitoxin (DNA-binding transcriptional repressor) of toxin-antitoxin stability system